MVDVLDLMSHIYLDVLLSANMKRVVLCSTKLVRRSWGNCLNVERNENQSFQWRSWFVTMNSRYSGGQFRLFESFLVNLTWVVALLLLETDNRLDLDPLSSQFCLKNGSIVFVQFSLRMNLIVWSFVCIPWVLDSIELCILMLKFVIIDWICYNRLNLL